MSAVAKNSAAYEHVDPAAVGNAQRVLVSELSGRSNIWSSLRKAGLVREVADDGAAAPALGEARWKERTLAILERVARRAGTERAPSRCMFFGRRSDAAAATWIVRGDESRRRRGCDVDRP